MKVGVISDTHDRLPTFRQALAMFQRLNVGAILHAGDLVAPFAAKLLKDPDLVGDTPVFCIYGNNDGERQGLKELLPQIVDGPLRLELPTAAGQSRIVVMHHFIDWLNPADRVGADVVISGHNHEASVELKDTPTNLSGKQLLLNPGECCGWVNDRCTVAVLDLDTMKADIVDIRGLPGG
ncbi:MAG: metallophosphoesterase [Planctomycetota bacterium]